MLEGVRERLVIDDRADNIRRTLSSIRDEGVWSAFDGLLRGFGENNRRLLGGIFRR